VKDGDAEGLVVEVFVSKLLDMGLELVKEDGGEKVFGGGFVQMMVIDFNEIDIENGFACFIDYIMRLLFFEDMSRFFFMIKSLSNVMGWVECMMFIL